MIDFGEVNRLEYAEVNEGDRWIYIADFNINHSGDELKSTARINSEVKDIQRLRSKGARIAILAHQGRFEDNDTEDLDFIVPHLSSRLGITVKYFPENTTPAAVEFTKALAPGEVAIMGNTRKNKGEEENDPQLSDLFSLLGDSVAVGAFGKAHRSNASNGALLDIIPAFIAQSQITEMDQLIYWAGKRVVPVATLESATREVYSVAVLGGAKKEKITDGLAGFVKSYSYVIPGGIVLNTLLKVMGYDIGDSLITDEGKSFETEAEAALNGNESIIYIPRRLMVAKKTEEGFLDPFEVRTMDGVPQGYMIVDFFVESEAKAALGQAVNGHGRIVMAGTPGIYAAGFKRATDMVMSYMKSPKVRGIVLGGDTAAEVKYDGAVSTGGGSALYFVAHGTTPVFEALKQNKLKFG